jgi:hypothetical protein
MLKEISRGCWRLDEWLQERFGRPYVIVLGVGLITDIAHRATELYGRAASSHGVVGLSFGIVVEVGLLIHQVGELHHHFGWGSKEGDDETAVEGPAGQPRLSRRGRRRLNKND